MQLTTLTNTAFFAGSLLLAGSLQAQTPGDMPPNAEAGKCYAKCLIADEYETVTQEIETRPASVRQEAIPAEYETVTEQVLKTAESTRLVAVPAEYETVTEQVLVKPESRRIIEVPAEYETVTEQVMIKEATMRMVAVEAEYETVTEQYEMEPATSRVVVREPRYETQTEQIETAPASTQWVKRKADRNCLSADPNDCLVWCLVETPAQYRTVERRVNVGCEGGDGTPNSNCTVTEEVPAKMGTRQKRMVKTPATTREEEVPAEYTTITKTVVKTPATTREEVIPAEYKTITRRVVKTPATTRTETIPAEYESVTRRVVKTPATTRTIDMPAEFTTVTRRQLVRKGGFTEWREIVCSSDVTSQMVRDVQDALRAKGYDPGPTDNVMGSRTRNALVKYQRENNLPVGQLDYETLRSLGVDY